MGCVAPALNNQVYVDLFPVRPTIQYPQPTEANPNSDGRSASLNMSTDRDIIAMPTKHIKTQTTPAAINRYPKTRICSPSANELHLAVDSLNLPMSAALQDAPSLSAIPRGADL
jgi:hypothetical protein